MTMGLIRSSSAKHVFFRLFWFAADQQTFLSDWWYIISRFRSTPQLTLMLLIIRASAIPGSLRLDPDALFNLSLQICRRERGSGGCTAIHSLDTMSCITRTGKAGGQNLLLQLVSHSGSRFRVTVCTAFTSCSAELDGVYSG